MKNDNKNKTENTEKLQWIDKNANTCIKCQINWIQITSNTAKSLEWNLKIQKKDKKKIIKNDLRENYEWSGRKMERNALTNIVTWYIQIEKINKYEYEIQIQTQSGTC